MAERMMIEIQWYFFAIFVFALLELSDRNPERIGRRGLFESRRFFFATELS